jgi:tryptophan synthase alpha chain
MESASVTTSSSELDVCFARLRSTGRRALVAYVTAGHPTPEASRELIRRLPGAGADVIEVGVPFSDPLADGPVIQASSQTALEQGMTLERSLRLAQEAAPDAPMVLFTYLNPLLAAGIDVLDRARGAGFSGVLVTDLPLGADSELEDRVSRSGLDFIRLVAPTTPPERVARIARHGGGFVYVISRLGVTGAVATAPVLVQETVARVRATTNLPVCVGFGISTPEQAAAVGRIADGVVVGSALVEAASRGVDAALSLIGSIREALDA